MDNKQSDPKNPEKPAGSEVPRPPAAQTKDRSPELHLVDLGEVSQNTSLTISTGKFEILIRLRKPKE